MTLGAVVNYLDRSVFGIAQPIIAKELSIGPIYMGYILSAFSLSYAFSQIPGGIFLDRFGCRLTYVIAMIGWSAFTLMQGFVSSVAGFISMRLGLGICEAPFFPANSRVLATWFPQSERARANAVYSVGQYAGQGFLSFPLIWIAAHWGWRDLFIIVGAVGILLGIAWYFIFREPHECKTANAAEIAHIEAGGGLMPKSERVPFSWQNLFWLLRQRQIVGAA